MLAFVLLIFSTNVNSLLFSFTRRQRHILHSNALAGILLDVPLEIVLLHLQIADEAVMDGYAPDSVLYTGIVASYSAYSIPPAYQNDNEANERW